jgi:hypothetical protein
MQSSLNLCRLLLLLFGILRHSTDQRVTFKGKDIISLGEKRLLAIAVDELARKQVLAARDTRRLRKRLQGFNRITFIRFTSTRESRRLSQATHR